VQCQQFCDLLGAVTVERLERLSDSAVIDAAMALEQATISRFLR